MAKTKAVKAAEEPSIQSNLYKVTITTTEPMLGTAPSNPDVYRDYIVAKKMKAEKKAATTEEQKTAIETAEADLAKEELEMLPEESDDNKGVTVFRRDKDGCLIIPDFMIRGFLKEGAAAIGLDGKTWGLTSKIDKFVFITDAAKKPLRAVRMMRDGNPITQPDGTFSRPLRAMTMQGPRVTLACSEVVNEGVELSFYVYVLPLGAGEKGKITEDVIRSWFHYGAYTGLGQWRTGGHGRFDVTLEAVNG